MNTVSVPRAPTSGVMAGSEHSATATIVSPPVRAWLAVVALGAGLLHAALAASAPLPALIVLATIGAAELGWAALTFAREHPPLLRAALFLSLAPIAAWAAVASIGAATEAGTILALPPLPLGVASALDLTVALTIAIVLRRHRPAARNASALRFVIALTLSAAVVCAVTIPALGQTDAGVAAVDVHLLHGGHQH
ncbi:hypothetical protein [Leifsonia poae]|uniref:hypothetical protein n=1 Tax=Leifsonia poae TaxID=110933 RepID=UPI001CC120B9|nr:hypothetical protein [Leifsonia poae]